MPAFLQAAFLPAFLQVGGDTLLWKHTCFAFLASFSDIVYILCLFPTHFLAASAALPGRPIVGRYGDRPMSQ